MTFIVTLSYMFIMLFDYIHPDCLLCSLPCTLNPNESSVCAVCAYMCAGHSAFVC